MKTTEATQVLKRLNWSTYRDEVGDKIACFLLPDRKVKIIYGVRNLIDEEKFEVIRSLSTNEFSKACAKIDIGSKSCASLIVSFDGVSVRAPEIEEKHICQASEKIITWAKKQDLNAALEEHSKLPTNSPGSMPVRHLGALAVRGELERLTSYQVSFSKGDRLGFVPYITKGYIDRAVALAEEYVSSS